MNLRRSSFLPFALCVLLITGVATRAQEDRAADRAFAATRPGHWRCDLYTLARQRLAAMGIAGTAQQAGAGVR